ncbi:MAG: HAD family phosphatase [Candidatus Jorgensenbacteria bacterium]|nr:HAD family phosphatase [Candidatus Jorgensenbacteria bacterium]
MENYQNIKAIAFDFWDVFAPMDPPMNHYLEEHGISIKTYLDKIYEFIVSHDLGKIDERQFLQECSRIVGVEIPYDQCRYVYRDGTLNTPLIEIVKKLKAKYKIALLSNNNREYVQEYVYKPGLDKLFDIMVVSYKAGYRKPAPKIYKILVQNLGVEPHEILFLDDDSSKLGAAEAQGLQTLVYKWGETDKILESLIK